MGTSDKNHYLIEQMEVDTGAKWADHITDLPFSWAASVT